MSDSAFKVDFHTGIIKQYNVTGIQIKLEEITYMIISNRNLLVSMVIQKYFIDEKGKTILALIMY